MLRTLCLEQVRRVQDDLEPIAGLKGIEQRPRPRRAVNDVGVFRFDREGDSAPRRDG